MISTLKKFNKGYTLLFAVLVAALVLAVGISILNISKKEFLLATSSRDSSEAFYAADAALECAVLDDQNGDFSIIVGPARQTKCLLNFTFVPSPDTDIPAGKFSFDLDFGGNSQNGPCANVVVTKTVAQTNITTSGYNKGWSVSTQRCEVQGVKRVERAIHYYY